MTPNHFGEPSLAAKEVADLKRTAAEKPNLAMAATWNLGSILVAIMIVSALIAV